MYAMLGSRPDICFAVNRLSQFGSNPDEEHLAAAIRVLQYLEVNSRHATPLRWQQWIRTNWILGRRLGIRLPILVAPLLVTSSR